VETSANYMGVSLMHRLLARPRPNPIIRDARRILFESSGDIRTGTCALSPSEPEKEIEEIKWVGGGGEG
jgi:hypothetical protein